MQSYTVILDWMLDLGLTSSELLAYATNYGFCMDGESAYTGSRSYLARKMAAGSKRTVDSALQGLQEKGLVSKSEKTINGVKFCEYSIVPSALPNGCENCAPGAISAPAPGANSAPKNKEEKIKKSPSDIAREEGVNWVEAETWEMFESLCNEPTWKKKTEKALRLRVRDLLPFPEIEARAMMENAIKGGANGTWQKCYELKPEEKARLYGQNAPHFAFPGQTGTSARPAASPVRSGGISASEEIVRRAMEQFNS